MRATFHLPVRRTLNRDAHAFYRLAKEVHLVICVVRETQAHESELPP
jgi:hypothetical protein